MKSFLLKNKSNTQVKVLDYGCRIISILVPSSTGELIESVLHYPELDDYLDDKNYLGCTIGRYANRISEASFHIKQEKVQLSKNENGINHLHGGFEGLDKKMWILENQTDTRIEFSYLSKDGEEGYPGNIKIHVIYELDDYKTLKITYLANTDRETILNLTNHSYFNLSGNRKSIDSHFIQILTDRYSPMDENYIPVIPFDKPVHTEVYDLSKGCKVAEKREDIVNANYIFQPDHQFKEQAILTDLHTGRKLKISSDYPSLQVYFGKFLEGGLIPCSGICCEPQYAPNSPNIDIFPSVVLKPGEQYFHNITYEFENY